MGTNAQDGPTKAEREIAAMRRRLRDLEQQHPRDLALVMFLREVRAPSEAEPSAPLYMGWRQAGIPRETFYRWARTGELDVFKVGRTLVAKRDDIERVVSGTQVRPARPGLAKANGGSIESEAAAHLDELKRRGVLEA